MQGLFQNEKGSELEEASHFNLHHEPSVVGGSLNYKKSEHEHNPVDNHSNGQIP